MSERGIKKEDRKSNGVRGKKERRTEAKEGRNLL